MGKKKELVSSAPRRGDDDESEIVNDAKMKLMRQPRSDATMHMPGKNLCYTVQLWRNFTFAKDVSSKVQ
ncbi:hypothetical protein FCM35_KLT08432 [Carex littledalei]|uniref:Uncharacterized protein n=1 Tax=Carex littledalei TaxID=544730 RepID=A0A833V6W5_9POAL|nr:hypothetical protein FCM35_KLT08432 [Carex littledalei]